ncbi:MAG: hypothetical protein SNJ74_11495, partial [Fimbriimonadaceae bacterium]
VFDAFGVLRHGTGALAPAAVREAYGSDDLDGLKTFLAGRAVALSDLPAGWKRCQSGVIVPADVPCPEDRNRRRPRVPLPIKEHLAKIGGKVLVGANALCALALIDIADDMQNAPGLPSCGDLCRAIRIWQDEIRNGSLVRGFANLAACKGAILGLRIGCGCD